MLRFLALPVLLVGCLLLAGYGSDEPESASTEPLNVVFILADDLGYMDVGAYNPDTFYETPHLDSLAQQGMMFTDGYAANPVCSPTRHSIMSGRHPSRDDRTE